ncbi:outer membrane protein assembly factor BamE domain-containing protein [Candidatus Liberibacter solanacearum]|uniref:outer membrane protein assembly factor BamE domain-containing protein n=2 Tax=Candidatus Liberibacter solanacearum TaxID=556287 RepID=UPI00068959CC|nr:outer membrane protein assembly factor BamE [Candidatus Liberibacter solanacearum]
MYSILPHDSIQQGGMRRVLLLNNFLFKYLFLNKAILIALLLTISMGNLHVSHGEDNSVGGVVLDQAFLSLIHRQSSREHVIQTLGSPSFTIFDPHNYGMQSFYYVSQKKKIFPFHFLRPTITNRTVLKIVFGEEGLVSKIAIQSLKDSGFNPNKHVTTVPITKESGFFDRLLNPDKKPVKLGS